MNIESTSVACRQYTGGCHCGDVRYRFESVHIKELLRCNCSLCSSNDYLHWFVPHEKFSLLSSPSALTEYRFHTKQARHLFCSRCGVKSFYQPRSHPQCWSVNARCVDALDWQCLKIRLFDGQSWSSAREQLLD